MNKKILIIEDDVFLGDVLLLKLKKENFVTELVRDGALGLQRIKEMQPDLVLLDIMLPTMNGYEILEAKVKDASIAAIPVIVISNSGQPVEISRVLALGVKDYLIKAQFDPEEVIVKVKQQLISMNSARTGSYAADSKGQAGQEGQTSAPDLSDAHLPRLLGKKIMWVEDDAFLNDLIARKLKTEGCALVHASEGESALRQAEQEMPDLILLDILLSGMDGFEILRKLKENPKIKGIPVVLLSNLGQQSDIDKAMQLGAEHFLIKATVTLDEVIAEIQHVLEKYAGVRVIA